MASNYGDLSRQLELRAQTLIRFFFFFWSCFLTDNRTEKKKGSFKRSLRRGKLDGKRSGCLANENIPDCLCRFQAAACAEAAPSR